MSAMIRCNSCGFENPPGALVCRQCRRRLPLRGEGSAPGPRRETEAELTLVVAREVSRLAWMIAGILVLGTLLAIPLYRRVEPGLLAIALPVLVLGLLAYRSSTLSRPEERRQNPGVQ